VIEFLLDLDIEIRGIIDHKNSGLLIETSRRTFLVNNVCEVELPTDVPVVLAVHNLYGDLHAISERIRLYANAIKIVTPVQLFQMFSASGLSIENYWLTTQLDIFKNSSRSISYFRQLLNDQYSVDLFDSILLYRSVGNLQHLPNPLPFSSQYVADDIETPPILLRAIDLGACRGENLDYFLESGRIFQESYFFEPDSINFEELVRRLKRLDLFDVKCIPMGVWSKTTRLRLNSLGNPATALSELGNVEIQVVALDDFIPGEFHPNFIKMDIEGAELNALTGMKNIILRSNPHLAISVYHKPNHLWAIGEYMSKTFPERYNYYLRMYGHQTFDTILYAVPRF
jgi:FkbM family methyltransferase